MHRSTKLYIAGPKCSSTKAEELHTSNIHPRWQHSVHSATSAHTNDRKNHHNGVRWARGISGEDTQSSSVAFYPHICQKKLQRWWECHHVLTMCHTTADSMYCSQLHHAAAVRGSVLTSIPELCRMARFKQSLHTQFEPEPILYLHNTTTIQHALLSLTWLATYQRSYFLREDVQAARASTEVMMLRCVAT
jgi:hypothetical protein